MYKVKFASDGTVDFQIVFQSSNDVEALEYALAIHRSSNVPHRIIVDDPDDSRVLTVYLDVEKK